MNKNVIKCNVLRVRVNWFYFIFFLNQELYIKYYSIHLIYYFFVFL